LYPFTDINKTEIKQFTVYQNVTALSKNPAVSKLPAQTIHLQNKDVNNQQAVKTFSLY
jgi:hypothetical protein